ncbi:MAG TPA: hypothetical protein VK961_14275 [Chthoniobacter sp.]|nr:hypothetical protein [Chthoniobacter sp.]
MKARLLLPAIFIATIAAVCAAEPDPRLTVHEWGTFTSVQGSDGVQMSWNPLVAPELPKFVYDRHPPELGGTFKISFMTRQRMETPVLYFYSDRARTLDVAVRFPEGMVTEWYPDKSAAPPSQPLARLVPTSKDVPPPAVAANLTPADAIAAQLRASVQGKTVVAPPALHWKKVEVLAPSADAAALPWENSGSHYYAARETDAALLRTTTGGKVETEKFLFYRGVASFVAPLTVKPSGDDAAHVSLTNSGAEELRNLFLYEVRADGRLAWIAVPKLAPGESQSVALSQAETEGDKLMDSLRSALVHEGLYEKEAAAMVKTWESSWFGERGVRVLYTLPREWTDRALPLAVTPAPKSIERVMVARAEVITPQMEIALREKMDRYVAAKPEERPRIVEETRALGFGRFIEAASSRARVGQHPPEYYQLSWELIQAARSAPKSAAKL